MYFFPMMIPNSELFATGTSNILCEIEIGGCDAAMNDSEFAIAACDAPNVVRDVEIDCSGIKTIPSALETAAFDIGKVVSDFEMPDCGVGSVSPETAPSACGIRPGVPDLENGAGEAEIDDCCTFFEGCGTILDQLLLEAAAE